MANRLWIIAAALTAVLYGQNSPGRQKAKRVQSTRYRDLDYEMYYKKYNKSDGVYLSVHFDYEHGAEPAIKTGNIRNGRQYMKAKIVGEQFRKNWTFSRKIVRSYMVLDPAAQWLTTLSLSLNPDERFKKFSLKVYSADGWLTTFPNPDIKVTKDAAGSRTCKFIYPRIRKGDIIEERFEIVHTFNNYFPSIEHEIDTQFYMACEDFTFSYYYPHWWNIRIKNPHLERDLQKGVTKSRRDGKKKKYIIYKKKNMPYYREDIFLPHYRYINDVFQLQVASLSTGLIWYTLPASWFALYREHQEGIFTNLLRRDDELKAYYKKEIKPSREATRLGKARYLIKHIQDSYALGGSKPFPNLGTIFNERLSDIWRNVGLAQFILKEHGITSAYTYVHSKKDGPTDEGYIKQGDNTLPALLLEFSGKKYLALPYVKNMPFDLFPESLIDEPAYSIPNPLNRDFTPERNLTSAFEFTPSVRTEKIDIKLMPGGEIYISENIFYSGYAAYYMRSHLSQKQPMELNTALKRLARYSDGYVIHKTNFCENLTNLYQPLVIRHRYRINNMIVRNGREFVFQTKGLLSPTLKSINFYAASERRYPVENRYNRVLLRSVKIYYPLEWQITGKLKEGALDNEAWSVKQRVSYKSGMVAITLRRQLKKFNGPPQSITKIMQFKQEEFSIPSLVFSRK